MGGLQGRCFTVEGCHDWSVADAKAAVEQSHGLLQREQRLLAGLRELADSEPIQPHVKDGRVELTLLRRAPLQAEWLERVAAKPADLNLAPDEIKENYEIVITAAALDPMVLAHASPDLWKDRKFVLEALKLDWHVWTQYVQGELKYDKQILIELLTQHARATRWLPESYRSDRDVVLAAIPNCSRELELLGPYRRGLHDLVAHQVRSAFEYGAKELRHDANFMVAAMRREPSVVPSFAAEELWDDASFVLEAVRQNGQLLEKASERLRSDRAVVSAAVQQDIQALVLVKGELRLDQEMLTTAVWAHNGLPSATWKELWAKPRMVFILGCHVVLRYVSYVTPFFPNQRIDAEERLTGLPPSPRQWHADCRSIALVLFLVSTFHAWLEICLWSAMNPANASINGSEIAAFSDVSILQERWQSLAAFWVPS